MASTIIILTPLLVSIIISFGVMHQTLVEGQKVPSCYFFGDSQFDNGNNNDLFSLAKVNYPPYGIDYVNGPTGRFANGPNAPDYLAQELLRFRNPIPPFVEVYAGRSNGRNGVNYASGGAGILDKTGYSVGMRFPMNRQLQYHKIIIDRFYGRNSSSIKNDSLKKALYVINIGSNDYLNNYLQPNLYPSSSLYTPQEFAQLLAQFFNKQLRQLYAYGARKVAVCGLGLVGCVPQLRPNATTCDQHANNIVQFFNSELVRLIANLNSDLPNANFTYINITNIALGDPSLAGLTNLSDPCCASSPLTGLCIRDSVPCSNRDEYAFWDRYHTSSIFNRATARRSYNGTVPFDASPYNIRDLVE